MTDALVSVAGWILLGGGGLLGVVGGIGVLRMPDFFTRLHAASITDTLCTFCILAGLALLAGWSLALGKLALVLVFLLFTGPTAAHALAKAALHGGLRPAQRRNPETGPSNT